MTICVADVVATAAAALALPLVGDAPGYGGGGVCCSALAGRIN